MKPQHIIALQAENVKKIKAVRIALDKKCGAVVISGSNGAGKTSVLNCIEMALAGKHAIPSKPIRNGEEKAFILLETEDLVVKRRFTASDSYLEVLSRDGASYKKPQEILDGIVTSIGFDPLRFSHADKQQQARELLSICPIDLDLAKNAEFTKAAESERRDLNRDLKRMEAQLQGAWIPPPNTPKDEVSVLSLSSKLLELQTKSNAVAALKSKVENTAHRISTIESQIKKLTEERDRYEQQLQADKKQIAEAQDYTPQIQDLEIQIGKAEEINASVRALRQRMELEKAVEGVRDQAKKSEAQVLNYRKQRADALADAKFPVPGLSLDADGNVIFNGVPLSQCSTSEQIKVGVALAACANPTLRVIFIKDGSLLDQSSMAQLEQLAAENDLQIWMERVEDNSPAAIQIHDGTNTPGE